MSQEKDRLRQLRQSHERQIVAELARSGPMSRAELMRRSGLSRTTLFDIIASLVASGTIVTELPEAISARKRGRPAQVVAINPSAGSYLGVDIGRAHAHAVIVNAAHDVVARGVTSFRADAAWGERVRHAHRLVGKLVDQEEITMASLHGVGLAVQGLVEEPMAPSGSGQLRDTAAMAADSFRDLYGVPVHVDNNTRAAAVAEQAWGIAKGVSDILYVRCSDGVSSGIISGGHLLRGAHRVAGEIGHVSVVERGPVCYCGNRGCLELYLGIPGLIQACAAQQRVIKDAAELVKATRAGDPVVKPIVSRALRQLGRVIAATTTQFDPARIIIAGELSTLGEVIVEEVADAVTNRALPAFPRDVEVLVSNLDENAAALGAVAQVMRADSSADVINGLLPAS